MKNNLIKIKIRKTDYSNTLVVSEIEVSEKINFV